MFSKMVPIFCFIITVECVVAVDFIATVDGVRTVRIKSGCRYFGFDILGLQDVVNAHNVTKNALHGSSTSSSEVSDPSDSGTAAPEFHTDDEVTVHPSSKPSVGNNLLVFN